MDRRGFFNVGAKAALGAAVLSGLNTTKAHAEETEVMAEISANHGHDLQMNLAELVAILRRLQPEAQTETVSIQGNSHPHTIDLSFDNVLKVLLGEEVVVESTEDFGHSHSVRITLEV